METGQKQQISTSIENNQTRSKNQSTSSSSSSLCTLDCFNENSSLSLLDFNALPDARKSVSLVHVDSKCSSIGSWLDNCFATDDAEKENIQSPSDDLFSTNVRQLYRSDMFDKLGSCGDAVALPDAQRLSEVPLESHLKPPFATGSDDSDNSEFEFNESELDIDLLLNEENGLNNTLTSLVQEESEKFMQDHCRIESPSTKEQDENTTTLDFLKGLGLAKSPEAKANCQSPPLDQSEVSLEKARIDSMYLAPSSFRSLPDVSTDDSEMLDGLNTFQQTLPKLSEEETVGEDVSDGRLSLKYNPILSSTSKFGAFDDWQCAAPLDFSGAEFQDGANMQQHLLAEEEFASADDVKDMLDNEEQLFEKENQFVLPENFSTSQNNNALYDFSTCRTSFVTVQGENDETGKVSIGAYMAKHSEKMGNLDGRGAPERPSFGLQMQSPSPEKPLLPLKTSGLSLVRDDSASSSKLECKSDRSSNESTNETTLKFDDTIDQSMMVSISNAISNMSSSMNNEELAQFIIALSNKKMDLKNKMKKDKEASAISETDGNEGVAHAEVSIHDKSSSASQSESSRSSGEHASACQEEHVADNDLNATLKQEDVHSALILTPEKLLDEGKALKLFQGSERQERENIQPDELPPLPSDATFSRGSTAKHLLSSTRTSLMRGSLSRESIEELHRKLREHANIQDFDLDTLLPRVLSNPPSRSLSSTSSLSKKDEEEQAKTLTNSMHEEILVNEPFESTRPSVVPLCQSSPEPVGSRNSVVSHDSDITRLSSAFHQLKPWSTSFSELETIAESPLPEDQVSATECIDMLEIESRRSTADERERSRSSVESITSKLELPSCSSVDPVPRASSTKTYEKDLSRSRHITLLSTELENTLSSQFSSMPRASAPMRSASDTQYPPVFSVMPGAAVVPHTGFGPPPSHIYHPIHPSLSLAQVTPAHHSLGPNYIGASRSYDTTIFSTASHLPAYNYPTVFSYPPQQLAPSMPPQSGTSYPTRSSLYDEGSVPSVNVPKQLAFDDSLCVGVPAKLVLPLHNISARWIQVELRSVSVTINERPAPLNQESYIVLKQKHVIGPRSADDTDLTLVGHEPGQYVVVVEVISHLIAVDDSQTSKQHCSISSLTVHANIITPEVQLLASPGVQLESRRNRMIDFGENVCGSKKSLPVRILNKSKVEVPIRLVLFTSSQERSCFSLSLSSSSATQQVSSEQGNLGSLAVLRTVLSISNQPLTVWAHFHAPVRHFATAENAVHIDGRIEVVLDAPLRSVANLPQVQTLLDTTAVTSVVGVGKLHAPRSLQFLTLSATRGSSDMKKIPVKNAGNISIQVSFTLENCADIFSLKPGNAILKPGDDVQLVVEFRPKATTELTQPNKPMTNLIFMNILPSGPQFEVQLAAYVTASQRPVTTTSAPLTLLTNKTRLRWGGVPVGRTRKEKLTLRCGTTNTRVDFRCSIKADLSSSFQIVELKSGRVELCTSCDMSVQSGEDLPVNVLFMPSRSEIVHAKLEIKTPIEELPATKFTIPLCGFGGTSQVTVDDLERCDVSCEPLYNNHVPEVYILPLNNSSSGLKLRNHGSRSAFIKLVAYDDLSCERVSSSIICIPGQFVIEEKSSREVAVKCTTQSSTPGYICIWHGDELSRRLLKKALSAHSSASSLVAKCVPQSHSFLRSVSFDGIFDGEGSSREEDLDCMEPHTHDVQTFYHNMKQTFAMVKTYEEESNLTTQSSSSSLSCQDMPERDVGLRLEQIRKKETQVSPDQKFSPFSLNWDVVPTHVTVILPPLKSVGVSGLPDPVRVKIRNQSQASLPFDVVWPGHYLTITPHRGCVDPESVAVLLISGNPSLSSRSDLLPWCGQAMVLATGGGPDGSNNSRTIYVQIKESTFSPANATVNETAESRETPEQHTAREAEITPKIQVLNNPLLFEDVTIGNSSKSQLEFRNMSKTSIKWLLTSLAPAYVKNQVSGGIFRSTYAAFVFSHKSGILEPGARLQLPATFNPMNVGSYSQHWELEYHYVSDDSAISLQREKVQLQGQGMKPQSKDSPPKNTVSFSRHDIYVSENSYWFPDTCVGKSSVIKIPIKNKGDGAHVVKFINLRPPFFVTHQKHSIRSKCCVNLPVTFKPSQKGPYTGTLVVQTQPGHPDVHVVLKGKAPK